MEKSERLSQLILESKQHTFDKNCGRSATGIYTRPSIDIQVWLADCEDFIYTNFGKDSAPGRILSDFNRRVLKGYHESDFNVEVAKIISALRICERLAPKSELKTNPKSVSSLDCTKVFIVHGHDETAKTKAARFVEKLGLEAIILHEQVSSSKTIIEKIEEYSNVGFGIVLYTPCDIGGKQSSSPALKARARQNVVFEHGFLIGKIGRGKVCALVKGDIETPNDISGVVYVNMDDSDAWCFKIAKELKKAGYDIDLNDL
jgi:predicted nucleotide-binding protein